MCQKCESEKRCWNRKTSFGNWENDRNAWHKAAREVFPWFKKAKTVQYVPACKAMNWMRKKDGLDAMPADFYQKYPDSAFTMTVFSAANQFMREHFQMVKVGG